MISPTPLPAYNSETSAETGLPEQIMVNHIIKFIITFFRQT